MAGFSVVKRGLDPRRDGTGLASTLVRSTSALNAVSGVIPVVNATDAAYGAKTDAQQSTGTITSGQNTLLISAGNIPAAGQYVMIPGAGPTVGAPGPFTAYVSGVAGSVATLVTTKGGSTPANASNTATGATVTFGTGCAGAVNTALGQGKRVHMPAGNYIWDASITPSFLHLTGDGIGRTVIYFNSGASVNPITVTGPGLVGATAALTANAAAGAQSLSVASVPTGLIPGDFLYLSSTTVFDAAESFCTLGEFCRVYGISGTTIYLNSPITGPFTYTTAATAQIQKMTFVEGVHISDIEWINGTPEKMTAGPATPATQVTAAGGGNVIRIKRSAWATFEDMKVTGWAGDFIGLTNCIHFRIRNLDAKDGAQNPAGSGGNNYGYTISAYGSQWGEIRGGSIEMCHGFFNSEGTGQVGGDIVMPTSTIEVRDAISRNGIGEPFLCHNASAFIDFIDCKVYGGPLFPAENTHNSGFQVVGYNCRVIDGVMSNVSGRPLALMNDRCEAINPIIRNVWPWNDRCDAIMVTGTNCKIIGADIDGVANDPATSTTGRGIYVQSGASGLEILRTTIRNTQRHGVDIQDSTAANTPIIDDLRGVNIGLSGTGFLINSIATLIPQRWTNVRGTSLGQGISNKPAVAAASEDRLAALRRGTVIVYRESFDRREGAGVSFTTTSGLLTGALVPVLAGDTFSKVAFKTRTTGATFAANNDGHWWLAVYDNSGNLIVQTADQGITAMAASTLFDLSLQSAYTPTADQLVRVSLMVYLGTGAGGVAPLVESSSAPFAGGFVTGLANQGVSGASALTTGVAPAAFGTVSTLGAGSVPYLAIHN